MSKQLSVKMQEWLDHVRVASQQGMTLSAYASAQGLSASALYQAKSQLVKVGAWSRSSRVNAGVTRRSGFVAARIVSAAVPAPCRLSHVSGWRIECESLPPAAWLNDLLRGATHVAA